MTFASRPVLRALLATALLELVRLPAVFAAEKPDVRARVMAPAVLTPGAKATLVVELTVGAGWHVNSHTPSESYLIPTSVSLSSSAGHLSEVRYPPDVEKRFAFSEKPLRIYEGTVRFETDLEAAAGADVTVNGSLSYQACNDRQCFPPAKIPLSATLAAGKAP